MAAESKIKLVQHDTLPSLQVVLTDTESGLPVNLGGVTVRLKFRLVGATVLTDTLVGTNTLATPGEVVFNWGALTLAGAAGEYEGELELTFPNGGIQTVYDPVKFRLRKDF